MHMTPVDAVSFVKRFRPESPLRWNGAWLRPDSSMHYRAI